ncbi:MAG TPA: FKBP-type peptidyl-prolyl cis-trans isomerase [Steroidobacteraceae bacterium]|nr:FKBP-type peptidyl-prolyl cis-trans isomerase [Steroidobacteraceae bacterium]
MIRTFALLLLCAVPAGAFAAAATTTSKQPMTEDDKVIFAVGEILSGSVKPFALSEHEMQLVREGFEAGLHGKKTGVDPDAYRAKIQTLLTARVAKGVGAAKAAGQAYRDKAATAPGATTTTSGIIMTTARAGSGPSPTAEDTVKVHYEGRLVDGTVFDSSKQHGGEPLTFKVSGVVPCWTEALQHMSVGAKVKLVCPPDLAYGDRGSPPQIPGGSTLIFDVELMAIDKAPVTAAPAAPDTSAAPAPSTAPAAPTEPASAPPPQ